MRQRIIWQCAALGAIAIGLAIPVSSGAEPAAALAGLREALRYGAGGDDEGRRARLEELVTKYPDSVAARGQAGYVRSGNEWVEFAQFGARPEFAQRRADYERVRETTPDTLDGHLQLADYCRDHELREQERVHLRRVLEFDPDQATARSRLGFVRREGDWVSKGEQREADERERQRRAALQKWRPVVRSIVTALTRQQGAAADQARGRQKALASLAAITDPGAVPALESELYTLFLQFEELPGADDRKLADVLLPLLRAIGRIPHPEAAQSLARIAVSLALDVPMTPIEAVVIEGMGMRFPNVVELERAGALVDRMDRAPEALYRAATEMLREYPQDSYVPYLLSGLTSPIDGQYVFFRERDGDVVVRLFYARETEEQRQGREDRTTFRPQGANANARARAGALSADQAITQVLAAHSQLQRQNVAILQRNLRVTDVLRAATDCRQSTNPDAWWNWWNDENEVFVEGEKPFVAKVFKQTVVVIAPPPPPPPSSQGGSGSSRRSDSNDEIEDRNRKKDCLAAGTPVWTVVGPKPVEAILPGDLVLAQSIESGELAYRPVLKTTTRPAGPLIEIRAGGETLLTSGGHPFWIVDQGWVRARQLKAGQRLYAAGEFVVIEDVRISERSEPTYNLIVEDFHSYFVGPHRILSHDYTVRQANGVSVPGIPKPTRTSR